MVNRFQLASTALTVTVKAVPEAAGDGCPTLPLAVPGAALSPGTNNCSLTKEPGLTTTFPEVTLLKLPLLKIIVIVSATG